MIYVIFCRLTYIAEDQMMRDLKQYEKDLNICQADLKRFRLKFTNGDEVHYIPECDFDRWLVDRNPDDCYIIRSLSELVKRKEE